MRPRIACLPLLLPYFAALAVASDDNSTSISSSSLSSSSATAPRSAAPTPASASAQLETVNATFVDNEASILPTATSIPVNTHQNATNEVILDDQPTSSDAAESASSSAFSAASSPATTPLVSTATTTAEPAPSSDPSSPTSSSTSYESASPPPAEPTRTTSSDVPPSPSPSLSPDPPPPVEEATKAEAPLESPSPPEFLSFNEWREKYVDPSASRRNKKSAQRARQEAGAGGPPGASFDGDGADLGSLFSASAEDGAGSGATQIVYEGFGADDGSLLVQLDRMGKIEKAMMVPGQATIGDTKPATNTPATSSVIHPLPSTGDANDPLIPLKDRSNYALFDCAAMVHRSSRGTKGASSILVEKKDRYMLTPCSVERKFVELELCDEIRIDTIVLANFELFSSMFKHFSIKVSQNYPGRPDEWHDLGKFRARNMRGVQVFRPAASLPGFYRYMRIDFTSHYGSEYYCPVSLLRVYGLTQLDAWRRDEERAKAAEALADLSFEEEEEEFESQPEMGADKRVPEEEVGWKGDINATVETTVVVRDVIVFCKRVDRDQQSSSASVVHHVFRVNVDLRSEAVDAHHFFTFVLFNFIAHLEREFVVAELGGYAIALAANFHRLDGVGFRDVDLVVQHRSPLLDLDSVSTFGFISQRRHQQHLRLLKPYQLIDTLRILSVATRQEPAPRPIIPPPVQSPQPGESIYGIIMKRLGSLEHEQTLSMQYIEAQGAMLRDAFVRMDKRVIEIENVRLKHDQLIHQGLRDLEKHFLEVDRDKLALASQVNMLTQELLFEKRLGVAQLIGLLALLSKTPANWLPFRSTSLRQAFLDLQTRSTPTLRSRHFQVS
ncbi:Sad1/UNC domain protein [Pseudohyphozyma bogoriensis]|nr:Sad1/UNC domain protein [Pseudohyphozyma bogoriensis]